MLSIARVRSGTHSLDVVESSAHHAADAKRPTSLPLWKVAPALTRATICAPLTSTRVTCIADENTAAVGQYFHETRSHRAHESGALLGPRPRMHPQPRQHS